MANNMCRFPPIAMTQDEWQKHRSVVEIDDGMPVDNVARTRATNLVPGSTEKGYWRKTKRDKEKCRKRNAEKVETSGSDYDIDSDDNTEVVERENVRRLKRLQRHVTTATEKLEEYNKNAERAAKRDKALVAMKETPPCAVLEYQTERTLLDESDKVRVLDERTDAWKDRSRKGN